MATELFVEMGGKVYGPLTAWHYLEWPLVNVDGKIEQKGNIE